MRTKKTTSKKTAGDDGLEGLARFFAELVHATEVDRLATALVDGLVFAAVVHANLTDECGGEPTAQLLPSGCAALAKRYLRAWRGKPDTGD